jgi:hypothetical protein
MSGMIEGLEARHRSAIDEDTAFYLNYAFDMWVCTHFAVQDYNNIFRTQTQ